MKKEMKINNNKYVHPQLIKSFFVFFCFFAKILDNQLHNNNIIVKNNR